MTKPQNYTLLVPNSIEQRDSLQNQGYSIDVSKELDTIVKKVNNILHTPELLKKVQEDVKNYRLTHKL